uniref:SFRICE_022867 n=1 Tax=Spodoptera frugiperda TaxID=7108 RepID=A0A2H1VJ62_SPOFR
MLKILFGLAVLVVAVFAGPLDYQTPVLRSNNAQNNYNPSQYDDLRRYDSYSRRSDSDYNQYNLNYDYLRSLPYSYQSSN